jgi:hypothetical protein
MPIRGRKMSPAGDSGSATPTITGKNINHVKARVATRNVTTIRPAVTPREGPQPLGAHRIGSIVLTGMRPVMVVPVPGSERTSRIPPRASIRSAIP